MEWPCAQIETVPYRQFKPRFCPRSGCTQHRVEPDLFRYRRLRATYVRRCDGRVVPRFVCGSCRSGFSQQSFAVSYYLKRPELTVPIAQGVVNGAAHLGRHTQLLHQLCVAALPGLSEPLNYDDFETFTGSQYHSFGLGTSVGHNSWFLYGLGFAPHRRGGHLSPSQRQRQVRWDRRGGKPVREPYVRSLHRQLDILVPKAGNKPLRPQGRQAHPGGAGARSMDVPDRHAAWVCAALGEGACARNDRIRTSERGPTRTRPSVRGLPKSHEASVGTAPRSITPAMWLRLTDVRWSWERVFAERLQPSRIDGGAAWPELYDREMRTPTLTRTPPHQLKLAY